MDTASRLLIVGGSAVLVYAFLLGIAVSSARMKAPAANRYLMTAHLAGIIQAAVLFGLSRVVEMSTLPERVETVAASLLVSGVALFEAGVTANWLQRVGDQFVDRPLGWWLLSASAPLNITGAVIVFIGVLRAL